MKLLEVCVFNFRSCLIAANAGARRLELCDNPHEGGTTPSHGMIRQVREKLSVDIYPIIRPRGGSLLYDADELEIIRRDVLYCKETGCDGISTGVALQNGAIDMDFMKRIVEWAYPMKVTCHRVFDLVPDPYEAMEELINAGCSRILTSGQQRTAVEGIPLLKQLVEKAANRIVIMVGGGVRSNNIGTLISETGATEFHTAVRRAEPDIVPNEHPGIIDLGVEMITDVAEIERMIAICNNNA